MRKAPGKQSPRPQGPRQPPADFCYAPPWPKAAPGPPPITHPVLRSSRPTNRSPVKSLSPTQLDGPTRGVPESKLMIKFCADKEQGQLSLMLKAGKDPNVMDTVEWQPFPTTPLFEASVNGFKRIVRLLLEYNADPDTVVGPGFTALYNAALNGHDECTELLVLHGANVATKTDAGFSPLYVACQGGHVDCVADILGSPTMTKEVADFAPTELGGATPIYIAAQNGHPYCVKLLLDAGVTVDPQMLGDGATPLMIAMFMAERDNDAPHIKICEMLFAAGASLDKKNNAGQAVQDLAGRDYSLVEMCKNERERRVGGTQWWE